MTDKAFGVKINLSLAIHKLQCDSPEARDAVIEHWHQAVLEMASRFCAEHEAAHRHVTVLCTEITYYDAHNLKGLPWTKT